MSHELSRKPSITRTGGASTLLQRAIARSTSKRQKDNEISPSISSGLLPEKDVFILKDDWKNREFERITVRGIQLEIPQAQLIPVNAADSTKMIVAPFGNNLRRDTISNKTPTAGYANGEYGQANAALQSNAAITANTINTSPHNPQIIYQHVQDMSAKRISTLDYLRKAHEGRIYWFNTVNFSKQDLTRLPYFEPRKLARRATNYLLLGLSLPSVLDVSSSNPLEYLRILNALLLEFESFQQIHPPDGTTSSSLSRARIPHMFRRATHVGTSAKGRRTSSATEIGAPMQSSDPADLKSMTGSAASSGHNFSSGANSTTSFPTGADSTELLPGEEYTHLLTPSLPFDPDFYETFATLCDVLIDCYTRIMGLVSGPVVCTPIVGEAFGKADARLRKVIVAGVVREFEDASRNGAKAEMAGVGKVVLGGLM